MSKPVYAAGSSSAYKKDRVAKGDILRISAELNGSPMEKFKEIKDKLGCGSTGVIQHLLNNYVSPFSE
jgi:hypothetical protein